MKKNELKILSKLVRNSRKSDVKLAKELGVSQPTVRRTRMKLEKEGYIREYTAIPNFSKLGFEMMAITFLKLKKDLDEETIEKAREIARGDLRRAYTGTILLERGIGLGANGIVISLHEDYNSYTKLKDRLKNYTFLNVAELDSFIINLSDEIRYKPLTLSTVAVHLLEMKKGRE